MTGREHHLKAITVRQPWALAIVWGVKDVENRSRNIAGSYRGRVLIHSSAKVDKTGFDDPTLSRWLSGYLGITRDNWTEASLPTGKVIGVANLADVHTHDNDQGACSQWALPGYHHLRLEKARMILAAIPAKGALGLWTPPDDVLSLLPLEDSDA